MDQDSVSCQTDHREGWGVTVGPTGFCRLFYKIVNAHQPQARFLLLRFYLHEADEAARCGCFADANNKLPQSTKLYAFAKRAA